MSGGIVAAEGELRTAAAAGASLHRALMHMQLL